MIQRAIESGASSSTGVTTSSGYTVTSFYSETAYSTYTGSVTAGGMNSISSSTEYSENNSVTIWSSGVTYSYNWYTNNSSTNYRYSGSYTLKDSYIFSTSSGPSGVDTVQLYHGSVSSTLRGYDWVKGTPATYTATFSVTVSATTTSSSYNYGTQYTTRSSSSSTISSSSSSATSGTATGYSTYSTTKSYRRTSVTSASVTQTLSSCTLTSAGSSTYTDYGSGTSLYSGGYSNEYIPAASENLLVFSAPGWHAITDGVSTSGNATISAPPIYSSSYAIPTVIYDPACPPTTITSSMISTAPSWSGEWDYASSADGRSSLTFWDGAAWPNTSRSSSFPDVWYHPTYESYTYGPYSYTYVSTTEQTFHSFEPHSFSAPGLGELSTTTGIMGAWMSSGVGSLTISATELFSYSFSSTVVVGSSGSKTTSSGRTDEGVFVGYVTTTQPSDYPAGQFLVCGKSTTGMVAAHAGFATHTACARINAEISEMTVRHPLALAHQGVSVAIPYPIYMEQDISTASKGAIVSFTPSSAFTKTVTGSGTATSTHSGELVFSEVSSATVSRLDNSGLAGGNSNETFSIYSPFGCMFTACGTDSGITHFSDATTFTTAGDPVTFYSWIPDVYGPTVIPIPKYDTAL